MSPLSTPLKWMLSLAALALSTPTPSTTRPGASCRWLGSKTWIRKAHSVKSYPQESKKLVQIAGILAKPMSLLILDDPCAALNPAEQEVLFGHLSQFQYAEAGIVFCTPSAEEALAVGDQISVLREGFGLSQPIIPTTSSLPK